MLEHSIINNYITMEDEIMSIEGYGEIQENICSYLSIDEIFTFSIINTLMRNKLYNGHLVKNIHQNKFDELLHFVIEHNNTKLFNIISKHENNIKEFLNNISPTELKQIKKCISRHKNDLTVAYHLFKNRTNILVNECFSNSKNVVTLTTFIEPFTDNYYYLQQIFINSLKLKNPLYKLLIENKHFYQGIIYTPQCYNGFNFDLIPDLFEKMFDEYDCKYEQLVEDYRYIISYKTKMDETYIFKETNFLCGKVERWCNRKENRNNNTSMIKLIEYLLELNGDKGLTLNLCYDEFIDYTIDYFKNKNFNFNKIYN